MRCVSESAIGTFSAKTFDRIRFFVVEENPTPPTGTIFIKMQDFDNMSVLQVIAKWAYSLFIIFRPPHSLNL